MSAAFGNMGGGTGNMIGSKLLSLFNSPPSMTQALLGQYYDPDELRKRKLGGAIMGIGQGLLSAQAGPGLTDAGVIGSAGLGMGQGLQNAEQEYIREAVGGYELSKQQEREKREEDERLAEQAKEADAQAQFEAFIETSGLDEPQKNFLRANPQAASKIMADRYFPQQMDPLKEMQIKKMQFEMDNPQGRDLPTSIQEYEYSQQNPGFGNFIGGKKGGIEAEVMQRKSAAEGMGLTPENPAYQSYILTGRMPREDQAPLTAKDKEAILSADEAVEANQNVIDQLSSVIAVDPLTGLSLNKRAGSGSLAGTQSWLARNDPTGFFDDKKGEATTELKNIVLGQALASLKSIFGAAPTEGERQILVELQASADKTPEEREPIVRRAMALADKRLAFNKQKAEALRGKTYYNPGGAPNSASGGTTSSGIQWRIE